MVAFALLPAPAAAWWNSDWAYRQQITIDTTTRGVPIKQKLNDVPVIVRLHTGNFDFGALKPDGGDLRFIAADDRTPLRFSIDRFDAENELALVRVMVPIVEPGRQAGFWVYFGNEEAPKASDAAAVQDRHTVLAFDFERLAGAPRDRTGFGNHAQRSTAAATPGGTLGDGLALTGRDIVAVPDSPSLHFKPSDGLTLTVWVRPDRPLPRQQLFLLGNPESPSIAVVQEEDRIAVTLANGKEILAAVSAAARMNGWQQIAVTYDGKALALYLDGQQKGSAPAPALPIAGPFTIGSEPPADTAAAQQPSFAGAIDEVELANVARAPDWLLATAQASGPEGRLVALGAAEEKDKVGAYLALLAGIVGVISFDGWVIIGMTVILAIFAAEVAVAKTIALSRMDRADSRFLSAESESDRIASADSPLARIESAARVASDEAFSNGNEATRMDLVRSAIARAQINEQSRLNHRMVLLTLAISGAPFLGLLGTVVGVMVTFSAIAAVGDVNVNTIAPGIAAAIATTVVGLCVAIPAMFAYNILMTRIRDRLTGMEVYGEDLMVRLAATSRKVRHAV